LSEQLDELMRQGEINRAIQPDVLKTKKEQAAGAAGRVTTEQDILGIELSDRANELGSVRDQRQAERAQATARARAGTQRAEQEMATMDATAGMIDQLAKAEAEARLAGDLTKAEESRQKRTALEAVRDEVARTAQLQAQADRGRAQSDIEQQRTAAFKARIAQLPPQQRIVYDADGNQKIETYVEEPQADGSKRFISLGHSNITPKEDVQLKRDAIQSQIDWRKSQAEKAAGGGTTTWTRTMGNPRIGKQFTVTATRRNGKTVRLEFVDQNQNTRTVDLGEGEDPDDVIDNVLAGQPPQGGTQTPSGESQAFDPKKNPKPSEDRIDAIRLIKNPSKVALAKAAFEKDHGVGSFEYYLNNRE
jgi:hypothetical protein